MANPVIRIYLTRTSQILLAWMSSPMKTSTWRECDLTCMDVFPYDNIHAMCVRQHPQKDWVLCQNRPTRRIRSITLHPRLNHWENLTMNISFPSCGVPMPCEAEFFGGWEMFEAFPCQVRFHNQTKQPGHKRPHCITRCQESQGKFSLLGRNIPRDSMRRVQDDHSGH